MHKALPIRAVALVVVAVFGFHMSRFYLAADLTNFVCPHHVAGQADHSAMQHGGHAMPQDNGPHRGAEPLQDGSGLRCCCRHTLDGLITTITLATPAELANVPLPDSFQGVALAADVSVLQNDLTPPSYLLESSVF